jgi:hypothetical protein
VFAPPGGEAYDTIDCARRAVSAPGVEQLLVPTLLPTIELLPLGAPSPGAPPPRLAAKSRRRLAAIAIPLVASPAAVAAGLSLVAAGTATSIYLGSSAFEGGGRVVAAPAPPAPSSGPGDIAEGHAPPSFSPVTTGPADEAAEVVPAGARVPDGSAQVESDAPEKAPAPRVEVAPSALEPGTSPPESHGPPVSHGEESPPHAPTPTPTGPRSHPASPPGTATPAEPAGESSSPPPPTSTSPLSTPPAHAPHNVPGSPAAHPPISEGPSHKGNKKPKVKVKAKAKAKAKAHPKPVATPAGPAPEDESDAGDSKVLESEAGTHEGPASTESGHGNGKGHANKP